MHTGGLPTKVLILKHASMVIQTHATSSRYVQDNNLRSLTLHFSRRTAFSAAGQSNICCSEPTWLLHWPTIQVEAWRQHVYPIPPLQSTCIPRGSKAYTRVLLPQKTSRLSSNWQLCMPLSSYANSERSASAQGRPTRPESVQTCLKHTPGLQEQPNIAHRTCFCCKHKPPSSTYTLTTGYYCFNT